MALQSWKSIKTGPQLNRCSLYAVGAVLLVFGAWMAKAQVPAPNPALARRLKEKDEVLLAAVHTGDREAWLSLAAPDFFYLDEEGGVAYLNEFLRQLAPMGTPPLRIQTYKLTRAGDTAIILHEDSDQHEVRYIFTETWQELNGDWKLRVLHITNVLSDPPAIQLAQAQIEELSGIYRAGSNTCSIRREGTRIIYQRTDGPAIEEKAETRDVLFTPGDPRKRKIFVRNASGRVSGFIVRYENSDIRWNKVP